MYDINSRYVGQTSGWAVPGDFIANGLLSDKKMTYRGREGVLSPTISAHRRRGWIPVVAAAVIILGALLVSPVLSGDGLVFHRTCTRGAIVASELLWTPLIEANAPLKGNVSGGTLQFSNQGGTGYQQIALTDGQAGAVFTLDNWSIFREVQSYTLGPGAGERCSSPFAAVDENRLSLTQGLGGDHLRTYYLAPTGTSVDAGIPSQFNLSDGSLPFTYPSVVIRDAFTVGSATPVPSVTTCGDPSYKVLYWNLTQVTVGVPLPSSLGNLTITAQLAQTSHLDYWFAPNGGTWEYSHTSSSGLAFSYQPCPA